MRRGTRLQCVAFCRAFMGLAAAPSASAQSIGPVQGSDAMVGTSGIAVPPVQPSEVTNGSRH
ncbi:MAG TPA: hypothetical protein VGH97_03430 [Thermoanaerobaculia bacterium]